MLCMQLNEVWGRKMGDNPQSFFAKRAAENIWSLLLQKNKIRIEQGEHTILVEKEVLPLIELQIARAMLDSQNYRSSSRG